MKNYLKDFCLICTLFLLWNCGESTTPVLPTATQMERLLGGDSAKVWRKTSITDQSTGNTLNCYTEETSSLWTFVIEKDSLITHNDSECDFSNNYSAFKYLIQLIDNRSYLKFYEGYVVQKDLNGKDVLVNMLPDTIRREIFFITNKEFTSEFDSLGVTYLEKFEAVE